MILVGPFHPGIFCDLYLSGCVCHRMIESGSSWWGSSIQEVWDRKLLKFKVFTVFLKSNLFIDIA